jgi:hypothetical protein
LNPQQLGALTYAEFLELYEGWEWRDNRVSEQMANLISWVTSPHVKKPIPPEKILNRKPKEEAKKKTTPEKTKNVVEELMQKMGVSERAND